MLSNRTICVSCTDRRYPSQTGVGANSFGAAFDINPPLSDDAEHNVVAAIVRWVEEDIAPETFIAARYNDNIAGNGLNFTRPVCKVRAGWVAIDCIAC